LLFGLVMLATRSLLSFVTRTLLAVAFSAALVGCVDPGTPASPTSAASPGAPSDEGAYGDDDAAFIVVLPDDDAPSPAAPSARTTTPPAGPLGPANAVFDAGSQDAEAPADAAGPAIDEAPEGACAEAPGPGDLVIDEIMIESVAGTGDDGEWLEVRNTRACALNLRGLHGECPRAASVRTFDIDGPAWIAPLGSFVVADSSDPAVNHDLPGTLVVWAGHTGDVLRNQGTTISLTMNETLIDAVTYPSLKLTAGQALAFPSDCDASARSDWTAWRPSVASWFPAFFGTPNAVNDDVHCR
jgi:hypothetical protein